MLHLQLQRPHLLRLAHRLLLLERRAPLLTLVLPCSQRLLQCCHSLLQCECCCILLHSVVLVCFERVFERRLPMTISQKSALLSLHVKHVPASLGNSQKSTSCTTMSRSRAERLNMCSSSAATRKSRCVTSVLACISCC